MRNKGCFLLSFLTRDTATIVALLMIAASLLPVRGEEALRSSDSSETLSLAKIFHIAGVPGVKRNARGTLVFSTRTLAFHTHKREALIVPYRRIRRVTFGDATREDAKGAYAAVLALGAPGALLLLQEHHVDTLVIDFDNERGGHMLALFQIPKKDGGRCQEWLARAGVPLGPAISQTAASSGPPPH